MTQTAMRSPIDYQEELYVLALRAAREIDLARRKKDYNPREIQSLIEGLRAGLNNTGSPADLAKNLAPSDIGVMSRALSAYGGVEPETTEDFAETLDRLFGEFSGSLDELEEDHLDRLIAFCVTLHDEMLSQKRSFREARKLRSRFRV